MSELIVLGENYFLSKKEVSVVLILLIPPWLVIKCLLQSGRMPLCQTIACLQRRYQLFKGIELLYSDKDPLSTDIILYLSHDGIRLVFDCWSQLLKVIEVMDMTKTSLSYCGHLFSSPTDLPSIEKINQTFSATHPGGKS
ncbi:hypothetical protein D918_04115 [Trichuris suis]|nr:hypothetical protein D918_04115 [Trichuris suis]